MLISVVPCRTYSIPFHERAGIPACRYFAETVIDRIGSKYKRPLTGSVPIRGLISEETGRNPGSVH